MLHILLLSGIHARRLIQINNKYGCHSAHDCSASMYVSGIHLNVASSIYIFTLLIVGGKKFLQNAGP